ncbi:MAG: ferredoxin [Methanolobus sp.]|nr:ferredoxin [Methanolobus sp.]
MADKNNKMPENVPGPYYVDDNCIACQVCADEAPDHFKMGDDNSGAYVFKQPENDEEKKACEKALSICPVDAIGNDG